MEQPILSVRCFEKLYRRGEVRVYNDRVERSLEPLLFGKRRLSMRVETVPFRLAAYVEAKRRGYWLTSVNLMCGGMSFSYLCFRRDAEVLRRTLTKQLAVAGQNMSGEVEDLDEQLTEQDHAMMRAFEREIVAAHDKNHAKHGVIDAGSQARELHTSSGIKEPQVLPGWQPDPLHAHSVRYHDGEQWTDFVHDYADADAFSDGAALDPLAELPTPTHMPSARPGSKAHDEQSTDLRHEHLPNVVDLRRHRA